MEEKYQPLLPSLSIAGYRSFGNQVQRIERMEKISLFIGKNNSGKSNILRLVNELLPLIALRQDLKLTELDRHMPRSAKFRIGYCVSLHLDESETYSDYLSAVMPQLPEQNPKNYADQLLSIFLGQASLEDSEGAAWFEYDEDLKVDISSWYKAFEDWTDTRLVQVWGAVTTKSGGGRETWVRDLVNRVPPGFPRLQCVMIPAIRKIGPKGSTFEGYGGEGLIEKLAQLQNPDVVSQGDRKKFDQINAFLQSVTGNHSARIDIPHQRDTVLVHMDGRTLPLESLGTGIHEVVILASAATILCEHLICMEEPELHLNPSLQKKLVAYLQSETDNQYIISTHSAALMDTPGAEVYHVSLEGGESKVTRVTSDKRRSEVCLDLGYRPSDLLQCNCIVWVEGPSDRIYLNYWLKSLDSELQEGLHYSIMFYGGKLLSHLSGEDLELAADELISLRRLNRYAAIVIDSDRASARSSISASKRRLVEEFDQGPGFAWMTAGREIENYLPPDELKEAINTTHPAAHLPSAMGRYANTLKLSSPKGKAAQANKVRIAKELTRTNIANFNVLDLEERLAQLVAFIRSANPVIESD